MNVIKIVFILSLVALCACTQPPKKNSLTTAQRFESREFISLETEGSEVNLLIRLNSAKGSGAKFKLFIEREEKFTILEQDLMLKLGTSPKAVTDLFGNELQFYQMQGSDAEQRETFSALERVVGCTETMELTALMDVRYCVEGKILEENQIGVFVGSLQLLLTEISDQKDPEGRSESFHSDHSVNLKFSARSDYAFYTQYLGDWKGTVEWFLPFGIVNFDADGIGPFRWEADDQGHFWIQPRESRVEFNNTSYFLIQPVIAVKKGRFISNDKPEICFSFYSTNGKVIHFRGILSEGTWVGSIFSESTNDEDQLVSREIGRFHYLKKSDANRTSIN